MNADDKLRGVVKRVAQARGHKVGPWHLQALSDAPHAPLVEFVACSRCGVRIRGPGGDVRTIPQCPTLFGKGKEG